MIPAPTSYAYRMHDLRDRRQAVISDIVNPIPANIPKQDHVTTGEEPRMTADQQKWEYCRLEDLRSGGFVEAKLIFFTAEGEKIESLGADQDSSQRNIVAMRIARLGDGGWDMVGTGVTGQGSHAVYFKRKKM